MHGMPSCSWLLRSGVKRMYVRLVRYRPPCLYAPQQGASWGGGCWCIYMCVYNIKCLLDSVHPAWGNIDGVVHECASGLLQAGQQQALLYTCWPGQHRLLARVFPGGRLCLFRCRAVWIAVRIWQSGEVALRRAPWREQFRN
jgi:hypothetical protein